MAESVNPEIVARAIIPESGRARAAIAATVTALRDNLNQKGADNALQVAAGRTFDRSIVEYVAAENIGTERNPDGKKIIPTGSEEESRKNRLEPARKLIVDYLEKGYDKLTPTQKDAARIAVIDTARNIPALNAVLDTMSAGEQQAYAEQILKDPKLSKQLQALLLEGSGDINKIIPDKVSSINAEYQKIDAELRQIRAQITSNGGKLTAIEGDLEQYKPDIGGGRPGTSYERMFMLQREIKDREGRIQPIQSQLEILTLNIQQLENERSLAIQGKALRGQAAPRDLHDIQTNIQQLKDQITNNNSQVTPLQSEIQLRKDTLIQLQKQEESFRVERGQITQETSALKDREQQLQVQHGDKQRALAAAKAERNASEEKFVRAFETMLPDAVSRYLEERVNEAAGEAKVVIEKQAQDSKDTRTKTVLDQMSRRWFEGNKANRDKIKQDYNDLLANGPDAIIRDMLSTARYSQAEIDRSMNDKAFLDEMRQKVGENVVKFHLLRGGWLGRGGKVSPDEIMKLGSSTWGQSVMENAIAGKKQVQEQINKAFGEKVVNEKGKFTEGLKKFDFKKLLKILLIILGIGGGLLLGGKALGGAGG